MLVVMNRFTVSHLLSECDGFSQIRYKHYQLHNMKQLFQGISFDNIRILTKYS